MTNTHLVSLSQTIQSQLYTHGSSQFQSMYIKVSHNSVNKGTEFIFLYIWFITFEVSEI